MKTPQYLFLLALLLLAVCCRRQPMHVVSSETQTTMLAVDASLDEVQDSGYLDYLAPITADLEKQLSVPLGEAVVPLTSGKPESPLLNWASDALLAMAEQVAGQRVDLAVVNAGGLRCEWQQGPLTFRDVFELMPFDNELVILSMSGENLIYLAQNCVEQGGQGVSAGFRVCGRNGKAERVTLYGKEIVPEAVYYVATSDYLSGGADGLTALTRFEERKLTGRKIRDLYIEYIRQQGAITASVDGRMQIY